MDNWTKNWNRIPKSWKIYTVVVIVIAYVYVLPPPIDPPPYIYPKPLPILKGPLEKNSILQKATRLFKGKIVGPESFAVNKNGTVFTGLADGRVVAFKGQDLWEITRIGNNLTGCGSFELEPVCGRPKGMKIDSNGDLLVLDSYFGLYRVNVVTGQKKLLVSSAKGYNNVPFRFLNGLDIDSQGLVYFTDSSSKWDRRNYRYEVMEIRNTGRFLQYNPYTDELKLLLDNLYLPNGVAISADESFILIAEMNICSIRRYYLKGPKAGASDIFAVNLPGYPDNIKINSHGNFYVGMGVVRYEGISRMGPFLDLVGPYPAIKRFIAKVTPLFLFDLFIPKHSMIVEYDNSGHVVSSLHDPTAQVIPAAGEGFEYNNSLYIGNFRNPFIGKLQLDSLNSVK